MYDYENEHSDCDCGILMDKVSNIDIYIGSRVTFQYNKWDLMSHSYTLIVRVWVPIEDI